MSRTVDQTLLSYIFIYGVQPCCFSPLQIQVTTPKLVAEKADPYIFIIIDVLITNGESGKDGGVMMRVFAIIVFFF